MIVLRVTLLALLLVGLVAAPPAQADTFDYNMSLEFSGGSLPTGSPTVKIEDTVANTVKVTMSTANLTDSQEFIGAWYFNVDDPALALTLGFVSGSSTGPSATSIDQTCTGNGGNACKADGDGFFHLKFEFNTSNSGDRFSANETVVYTISGTGLSASDFDILSAPGGGNGSYHSALHVQGIGPGELANLSGWLGNGPGGGPTAVSEPGTLAFLGVGLAAAGMILRRTRA